MNDIILDFLMGSADLAVELILVGLIFFGIEKLRPAEKNVKFFKDDFRQELGFALSNTLIAIPVYSLILLGLINFLIAPIIPYQAFNDEINALPLVLQAFFGAFILDFSTYWRHRFTHKYLWRVHSIHHSAEHLNWLTSMRLHPVDVLVAMIFDLTILHLLGFSGAGMVFAILLLKGFNYFTHANIELQFNKPMRYVFASPNFHRWHHAMEKEAHDKNFCSMFSCIDLIFGTYHHPENALPKGYGIGEDQQHYPQDFIGQILYPFRKKRD
ncbi:MAG: sterol desaturase family protein [Alphaproteobacteria bacterium]